MEKKPSKQLAPGDRGGFFYDISLRLRLIARLMADRRVNPLLKLLPVGSLLYLVIPGFIPPDFLPGPIDDAAVVWLGFTIFLDLCPAHIVQEHMDAMTSVVEGEFREVDLIEDENSSSSE
ncbi:MAG: hypothetical protein PVJ07_00395 [Anaerolineales bacterium]|jgi:uncharacterized membrane protein YkvA (DUF1232 family)